MLRIKWHPIDPAPSDGATTELLCCYIAVTVVA
ncbi:hypothetical protein RLDS_16030 [Sphingobium lactosutens DS20]|uniref:Uncharacterized protein n=1 Tax=Sphingobium lactosutens DS20 TaxID=1331060 RepID=T0IN75_9SPHN|nr:hypothetical protein RLDS_16030 [Sphingobium lactosutens DS20]